MDHRDRRAPVALTGDQPVADAIGRRAISPALGFDIIHDGGFGFLVRKTVEAPRVHLLSGFCVRLVEWRAVPVRGCDYDRDIEAVFLCEGEVALVVRGHAHDSARTVPEECVVGDPDRHLCVVKLVAAVGAGEDPGLFSFGTQAFDIRLAPRLFHVRLDLRLLLRRGDLGDERVFRRQHHRGDAEDRVGPRRKYAYLVLVDAVDFQRERDFKTLGAADPVSLHRDDLFGPVQVREVQQFIGVFGDAEEPLLEVLLNDGGTAAFAGSVRQHLLVGQHGLAGRAPVSRGERPVGEVLFVELQEEPLVPAVVLRVAADRLMVPVEHRAHRFELAPHALDVAVGPLVRVDALLDRRVLRGQAEGVEADGEEDVVAAHSTVPSGDVRWTHCVPVPDVKVPGCVGEHRQEVELALRGGHVGAVEPVSRPSLLPLLFDCLRVVSISHLRLACRLAFRRSRLQRLPSGR